MDVFEFNKDHGYLEGLIRGLRNSLLSRNDYSNISQADSLEDLKLALQGTDYSRIVSGVAETMSIKVLEGILHKKYLNEFNYIRSQAYEPLATFMDFLSYGYQIDNIALLISGIIHETPLADVLQRCHPLGKFDRIGTISACSSPAELYNAILVDTPLAKFFANCVSEHDFDETHVIVIRNLVYREYMEDFFRFTQSVGGITGEVMKSILQFEADRRSFIITMNSLGTDLSKEERMMFYNSFGKLDQSTLLRLSKVDDFDQIKLIASCYDEYGRIFGNIDIQNTSNSIEDGFFEHEVKMHNFTFLQQFNFGVFYSYFRLLEQQMRNLIWIGECVSQQNKTKIEAYVKVYP